MWKLCLLFSWPQSQSPGQETKSNVNDYVVTWKRFPATALQWRHNGHDGVSSHQPHDCLLSRLFRRRSKKTSKLRVTGLCAGNSPVTGEFPAQKASYVENASIWWLHHGVRCERNPPVTGRFPSQIGQQCGCLKNSPVAGNLKRHYAHATSLEYCSIGKLLIHSNIN